MTYLVTIRTGNIERDLYVVAATEAAAIEAAREAASTFERRWGTFFL